MWSKKSGEGLWTEMVNEETGESSITLHTPKTIWKSCPKDKCYFQLINPRLAQCRKCAKQMPIVIGKDTLIKGKIIRS